METNKKIGEGIRNKLKECRHTAAGPMHAKEH